MARGFHTSNREKRRRKTEKPKPAAQTSPFERSPGMGGAKRGAPKKGR